MFGTDLLKALWALDVEMMSMRRRSVASTSLRRHVPAGNLPPPPGPPIFETLAPQYSKPSYAYDFVSFIFASDLIWGQLLENKICSHRRVQINLKEFLPEHNIQNKKNGPYFEVSASQASSVTLT